MPSAIERLRSRKQANHRDVPICVNPSLPARRAQLEDRLSALQTKQRDSRGSEDVSARITEIEEDLSALADEIREVTEWIRIKALAPDDYQKLIDDHQPTKDQLREARKLHGARASLQWNTDTFPDALLAEAGYVLTVKEYDEDGNPDFEPGEEAFTEELIKEMHASGQWSPGEVGSLVNIAIAINESTVNIGAAGNG